MLPVQQMHGNGLSARKGFQRWTPWQPQRLQPAFHQLLLRLPQKAAVEVMQLLVLLVLVLHPPLLLYLLHQPLPLLPSWLLVLSQHQMLLQHLCLSVRLQLGLLLTMQN